jgi:hypothetical protein
VKIEARFRELVSWWYPLFATQPIIRWVAVAGSIASLIGLYVPFLSTKDGDVVVEINKEMGALARPSPSQKDSAGLVSQVETSIVAICEGAVDIDRAVGALRAYLLPKNSNTTRSIAVSILAELAKNRSRGA